METLDAEVTLLPALFFADFLICLLPNFRSCRLFRAVFVLRPKNKRLEKVLDCNKCAKCVVTCPVRIMEFRHSNTV